MSKFCPWLHGSQGRVKRPSKDHRGKEVTLVGASISHACLFSCFLPFSSLQVRWPLPFQPVKQSREHLGATPSWSCSRLSEVGVANLKTAHRLLDHTEQRWCDGVQHALFFLQFGALDPSVHTKLPLPSLRTSFTMCTWMPFPELQFAHQKLVLVASSHWVPSSQN